MIRRLCLGVAIALPLLAAAPPPPEWPYASTAAATTTTLFEPQAITWPDQTILRARSVVSVTRTGHQSPTLGILEFTGDTEVDNDTATVIISNLRLISSHFPSLDAASAVQLEDRIKPLLSAISPRRIPLDTLLLSVKHPPANPPAAELNNSPPKIFYAARPAILVALDGPPVLAPLPAPNFSRVVNTNWDIRLDKTDGAATWYLLANGRVLSAPSFAGPFTAATDPPASLAHLQAAAHVGPLPAVFVSTTPAELIVSDGTPTFKPVKGTGLAVMTNTTSTILRDHATQALYYLTSGRWFTAPSLEGPWEFATPNLPADFTRIPPDSPFAPILAAVPGTAQAQAAVLAAQIPHQVTLPRETTGLTVTYDGPPLFRPIPASPLRAAVNTPTPVIEADEKYYACDHAAWFTAAAPTGPWMLADQVPPAIATIPPTSPLYNVTFVHVMAATPQTVSYATTSGYTHAFISAGVLVYGTGYDYPPYIGPGTAPIYLRYPGTYPADLHDNTGTDAAAPYGPGVNIYAGADGNAYQHSDGGWSKWNNGVWQKLPRLINLALLSQLEQDRIGRQHGQPSTAAPARVAQGF